MLANSFEAEVFVQLLLEKWKHPLAQDADFREGLLESTTIAIQNSLNGVVLLEPLKPDDFNFIAAIWFVEWSSLQNLGPLEFSAERTKWLDDVKRSLPSCFCDPDDLV